MFHIKLQSMKRILAKLLTKIVTAGVQMAADAFMNSLKNEFTVAGNGLRESQGFVFEIFNIRLKTGQNFPVYLILASRIKHIYLNVTSGASSDIDSKLGMTLNEAKKILNVENLECGEILKAYDYLLKVNDPNRGGTLYLKSKVYVAKQRLDAELKLKELEVNQEN